MPIRHGTSCTARSQEREVVQSGAAACSREEQVLFFFFFFEVSSCFGLAQTLPFSLSPFEMREGCCYSLLQLNCTLGFFLPFTPRGASSLWLANAIGRLGRSLSCVGKTQKGTTKKNWA